MENKKYKFVKIEALPESSSKKFKVILENLSTKRTKTIQFGGRGFENYTGGHLDEVRKQSYIARHNKREDCRVLVISLSLAFQDLQTST